MDLSITLNKIINFFRRSPLAAVVVILLLLNIWSYATWKCPYKFAGGSPAVDGSCWCGWDKYCLCSPSLAIDCIIELHDNEDEWILLVERGVHPPGVSIVGGYVEVGESVESAAIREVKEETSLNINTLRQFHVYSSPTRDPRRHTATVVFTAKAHGIPKVGDDAKKLIKVKASTLLDQLDSLNLAFDHKRILSDYIYTKSPKNPSVTHLRPSWYLD